MKLLFTHQSARKCPNILLIVMDATRAKSLSCYGYHQLTTPNLDRFAERSVVYEKAISPGNWSLTAHASIFTGLYPSRHGAHDQHKYLSPNHPTMAELLRSLGYRTLAFCYNAYVSPATGLHRGFEAFNQEFNLAPKLIRKAIQKADSGLAYWLGRRDSGARYVNRQIRAVLRYLQTEERPFFLFIHYEEPHAPYRPPNKYNRYLPKGVTISAAKKANQDRWKYFADIVPMNERDFEILTALYDAEITYLDSRIAELLSWLDEMDVLDQSMVIITADHGENIGDHQMMGHAYCMYDTLLHVPLIIHYPNGVIAPGRVTHQVQTLDLLPTLLAMLGDISSQTYRSLQGHDLLSSTRHNFTIAEETRPDLTVFYDRFPGADVSKYDRALKMIRTDRYKYIWSSKGDNELYDLQVDPGELHNIISEFPGIAASLDRQLAEWSNSFEAAAITDEAPEFEEVVAARLRDLGYLE